MVLYVKYHQTTLNGVYVADTCKLRGQLRTLIWTTQQENSEQLAEANLIKD